MTNDYAVVKYDLEERKSWLNARPSHSETSDVTKLMSLYYAYLHFQSIHKLKFARITYLNIKNTVSYQAVNINNTQSYFFEI